MQDGDIWFAGDARLVYVSKIHCDHVVEVCLVHPYTEFAASRDHIVPQRVGAPYPLVIQVDLAGCVWSKQLVRRIGHVESVRELPVGIELQGPSDPRWEFKKAEGEALRALTAECTSALLSHF